MKEKLVSVIIPTYGRPQALERTINSILGQTYKNIEIIVVDDNDPISDSRRKTEKIMEKYKHHNNIRYVKHSQNKNGSAARNTGWRKSRGHYITFVDDDDELCKNKIREQVNCLEGLSSDWGMCYTKYVVIKENGKKQTSSEKRSGYLYIDSLMRTMFMGSGSNLMLRKKVVDDINGYDETFNRNQDIEFLARACEKYKLAYVDNCLLIIHQEGHRKKRTFAEIDDVTKHYLSVFGDRINKLEDKDRERVISVISLERFRSAMYSKKIIIGFKILLNNRVKIIYLIKYFVYLAKRAITHNSYGFYI